MLDLAVRRKNRRPDCFLICTAPRRVWCRQMQVTGSAYTKVRENSYAQKWAHLTTFERCANIIGAADSPDTDLFSELQQYWIAL
ncbi:hypothetical protein [Primorskyibacter flagellatus]|uniref:hypothetical protein n=1 Tax=Primorskyibacter flagellatus TaxID=1387277 RepID=UPI003A9587E0